MTREPNLANELCTRCGLCCNGSFFSDVEITKREASEMEAMGLDVDDDEQSLLLQPCSALSGRKCSIYPYRPQCCRTFECKLLKDVARGAVSIDEAKKEIACAISQVQELKILLRAFGQKDERMPLKERWLEVQGIPKRSGVSSNAARLNSSIRSLEKHLQRTFLPD